MSEAWREVARLGKVGHQYPHILADSRGWCLRWGPRDGMDDQDYTSLSSLLHGLAEHYLWRRMGGEEDIRSLARFRELVELSLKEAAAVGAALDRRLSDSARLRPLNASQGGATARKSVPLPLPPENGAVASAGASEVA